MVEVALEPPKTFTEAAERFVNFLPKAGYPAKLRWIFRDDVVADSCGRLWVRHKHESGFEAAARLYQEGRRRNFGIALSALGATDTETIAMVFVPSDDLEAQYHLMGPGRLKLSALVSIARASTVTNPIRWWILKICNRKATNTWNESFDVPSL